jgi:crotonobetainyl-CoA:carnitine CoA-transferase CaiB-like acyl-CoA transferase
MMLPLEGLKVLDLSRVLAGPYATMVLADLGADVVKVEHPGRGDDTRHWGPPFTGGEAAYFLSVNRNKRSIGVDLKTEEGVERIKKLAAGADVLIENMRRGALEKLGLGYEALKETNPGLVYCSVTGFGPGKDGDRPGYDFLIQARAGIMGITGFPDGEPTKVGVAIADIVCGLYAASAILAALRGRERTGEGARIEVPLFEATLGWLANRAQEYLVSGEDEGRMGNAHPTIVPYQTFDASDKPVAVAVGNDAQFARLCEALGREDLSEDERYATNPDRVANREELVEILQRELLKRTAGEWIEKIRGAGVPIGPVNSLAEALSDEHLLGTDMLQEVGHPVAKTLKMLASPVLVDGERLPIRRPPPTLGQHTDEATGGGWV